MSVSKVKIHFFLAAQTPFFSAKPLPVFFLMEINLYFTFLLFCLLIKCFTNFKELSLLPSSTKIYSLSFFLLFLLNALISLKH